MINPHKGDLSFLSGGKSYTLRYSHLALVKLEQCLDKSLVKIMKEIDGWQKNPEDMRLGTVVSMLWAGLQKHHPEMTPDDAAEIIDGMDKGVAGAVEILGQAFQKAFNAPGSTATNPPPREVNGSGTKSSSNSSPSDIPTMSSGTSLPAS